MENLGIYEGAPEDFALCEFVDTSKLELQKIVRDGLDRLTMKQWAVEKGATHFTHWFQPMTGVTAEKHDTANRPPAIPTGRKRIFRRIW